MYKAQLQKFLSFVGKTPEQILAEYGRSSERKFRMVYAQYVKALIGSLQSQGYAPASIGNVAHAVTSFFKYSDLPLGFIPSGSKNIEFHNKDIAHSEILEILKVSSPRDRGYFCVIAQSGLRPQTVSALQVKDVEGILTENTPVPCKIEVGKEKTKGAYSEYFSFVGIESVQFIKDYLKTRAEELTPESFLFTMQGKETPVSAGVLSHIFQRTVDKLRNKGILTFSTTRKDISVKNKDDKELRDHITRSEVRLYNLRKFFRKFAGQAGVDFVNYWMGHLSAQGTDLHYISQDREFHRKQYVEKAMPFLRLETSTPSEFEKQLETKTKEIQTLQHQIKELQPVLEFVNSFKQNEALQLYIRTMLETERIVKQKKEPREPDLSEQDQTKFESLADDLSISLARMFKKLLTGQS